VRFSWGTGAIDKYAKQPHLDHLVTAGLLTRAQRLWRLTVRRADVDQPTEDELIVA
jgi:hypothetical protein